MKKIIMGLTILVSLINSVETKASPVHDYEAIAIIKSINKDKDLKNIAKIANDLGQEVFDAKYKEFVIFTQYEGDVLVSWYKRNGEFISGERIENANVKNVINKWTEEGLLLHKVFINY